MWWEPLENKFQLFSASILTLTSTQRQYLLRFLTFKNSSKIKHEQQLNKSRLCINGNNTVMAPRGKSLNSCLGMTDWCAQRLRVVCPDCFNSFVCSDHFSYVMHRKLVKHGGFIRDAGLPRKVFSPTIWGVPSTLARQLNSDFAILTELFLLSKLCVYKEMGKGFQNTL